MEKQNPLLPFAFTRSNSTEIPLDATPRSRATIDENAQSLYHNRTTRPVLEFAPNLKRRMGESFNEKDDIKKRQQRFEAIESFKQDDIMSNGSFQAYSEDPTMIDTSEDLKYEKDLVPPSSPVHVHSDDKYYDKFWIPQSPQLDLPSRTSPTKIYIHELESETDFGIDKFSRFKPSGNNCPSTDRDTEYVEETERQRRTNLKARDIVIQVFEDMENRVDLEGLGLTEVPHEIKDLNNLVTFDESIFQVYLTNNKIRFLNPSLFKFTKLNVLALRSNKLERIPASIKKLVNLIDLSIGTNRLQFLPHQILHLNKLTNFRAGPNPYILPENAIAVDRSRLNSRQVLKYVSKIRYMKHDTVYHHENCTSQLIPSLKTLCLSKIAQYDISYQETKEWKRSTPKLFHNLITKGIAQGKNEETCCQCERIIVEPIAEVIEWFDFLNNKDIPFKKEFCSGMCVESYKRDMLDIGVDLSS